MFSTYATRGLPRRSHRWARTLAQIFSCFSKGPGAKVRSQPGHLTMPFRSAGGAESTILDSSYELDPVLRQLAPAAGAAAAAGEGEPPAEGLRDAAGLGPLLLGAAAAGLAGAAGLGRLPLSEALRGAARGASPAGLGGGLAAAARGSARATEVRALSAASFALHSGVVSAGCWGLLAVQQNVQWDAPPEGCRVVASCCWLGWLRCLCQRARIGACVGQGSRAWAGCQR